MKNTVTVTFKIDGVEIKTNARVPQLKNGINADNMIVLNAKSELQNKLGIDIYKVMNAEHYEDIKDAVFIDKSNFGRD
ncbi:hypothetical protein [Bacillus pumilus]|uniref:hypothetical protein n=1 Tax=Bacillus pumilus TaxID=1408 RepID=UPI00228278D5|nr:hypothetical protein [Bacillus pumilus]MCY7500131.1 hypothetical protein [Bacillus pumilus]MCY7528545.1 hypothetical protein [Bacillus pumilus]MED4439496.1 hypothetical protein [Bacillus pumilus]MED4489939.1 hypothetical protein [Bacillus pumilus]